MFAEPTVFILGAGASWHYGYPTGEELVKKVLEKAELLSKYLENSVHTLNLQWPKFVEPAKTRDGDDIARHWQVALDKCSALKSGLEQVRPLIIDYYLGWNASFKDLGRLLIAWVILDCERRCTEAGAGNINRRAQSPVDNLKLFNDDWCRFLLHKLAINCKTSFGAPLFVWPFRRKREVSNAHAVRSSMPLSRQRCKPLGERRDGRFARQLRHQLSVTSSRR